MTTGICTWIDYDGDGIWATDCGQSFGLDAETPSDNGMKFCCYCGKTLVEGEGKVGHSEDDE